MKDRERYKRILSAIHRFVLFFIIAAFLITTCMMLFLNIFAESAGISLTNANVEAAAKLTFINVFILALAFTVVDLVRIRLTVDRPTRRIIEAAEKMAEGDFSVRIKTYHTFGRDNFNEISECFNKMAEELSGVETLRTDFIASVSHELKTPLAVIQNYAAMLRSPNLTEEKRLEYSAAISDSTTRLASLITNILKLNKLENQQMLPNAERFDLGEHVSECMLAFEDVWEKKGLEIQAEIEDGITVRTDREMMSILWNNLFSNAIKFTEPGGTVGLEVYKENSLATVKIRDTGCGISADVGKHIFEKFYQGDTSHSKEGNGLGLALVRRIADITGAEISVTSEVGVGTEFTVSLRTNPNE